MEPQKVIEELSDIIKRIQASRAPSRRLVAKELKKILMAISPEEIKTRIKKEQSKEDYKYREKEIEKILYGENFSGSEMSFSVTPSEFPYALSDDVCHAAGIIGLTPITDPEEVLVKASNFITKGAEAYAEEMFELVKNTASPDSEEVISEKNEKEIKESYEKQYIRETHDNFSTAYRFYERFVKPIHIKKLKKHGIDLP